MQISATAPQLVQTRFASTPAQANSHSGDSEPTAEEQKKVVELKKRDREVRRHEQAHKSIAGSFALGGPTFKFVTGPDGRQYAVGGEVKIDTSEVAGNPEATLRKAQTIRRAALAPQEPSSQDRKVAAEARKMETKARREIAKRGREKHAADILSGRQQEPDEPIVDTVV